MKKLIASIEEHVAFYGPNGCDVESLWPVMQAIEATKSKCWRVLVGMKSLEFYNDNQKLDRPRDMKLEHADSIRVVAPAELRKKVLLRYAPQQNPNLTLNANQFAVLDKIANTRRDGILQIQVARELGVDSRAVYPVIKRLEEHGLIIKTRVSTNKTWTNLLHHIRFSPDEMVTTPTMDLQGIIHYDTLQKQLVNVLSEAKDDMIPMAELFKIFGFTTKQQKKWMSRFFVRAIEEGYIEKKRLVIDGIKTVCIKLLHSPIQKEEQEAAPKPEEDTESSSSKKRKRQYGQLYGKELQDRIVQVIGEANDKGMTRRQVEHALPEATPSAIKHFLKSIISMNNDNDKDQQLFHVIEAQGRGRCYRYFTRVGLDTFLSNRGQILAGPNHDQEGCADENETSASAAVPEEREKDDDTSNGTKRALTTTTNETPPPPPSKRVKTVTEGGFTKGTRQSMKGTNVTMDNRRNAMATIVLRDKVRELHGDLREEIMVQAGEADSNHVIARATLMRMAERLEKSNVIRIMKTAVPTMTGAIETKILLLHPDVGDNDEIVKQYMERLRMNRMVKPIVCRKLPELEVYDRGESATPSTSNEMTPRQHAALQKVYGAPDKYWREVALRHGWLSSRWLRARVLHEYLFDQKNSMDAVDFGNVISHMPLDVYRKAFGICSYTEEAEEFLRNNDNPEIPLSMIPSNLHPTIITSTSRLRHRLFKLLAILEALELMEPHTLTRPTTATEERPTITLTRIGRIRNFLDASRPILKEIEFHSLDNVKAFWDELQFTCTCEHTRTTGTPRGQGEKEDLLSSITIARTWGIHILLNPQQRQLLESHVDRTKGKAPCDDDKLILHLSRQVSLAPSRVKRYFEGIMRLHHGGPSSGSRPARKTRPPEVVSNLIKSAISGESVQAYKSNNIEQTFTPTRRYLRHRFPTSNTADLSRPKKYRKWKKTEQDVLIHAFTIMRQRADALHIPIAWRPIEQVLPGWDYETCRRRLHHMKSHSPHLGQDLVNLKQQWIKIYNDGIRSGELVDDRPWDVVDFDLPGQLEYFVTKLHASPVQINASLDRLPDHRQELLDLYNIVSRIPYQHMETMLTVHGDRRNLQHDPTCSRITHIAVLIKMVLLTATSDYDPKIAHTLLERFSQQETMDATRYLRDAGVLIKNRSFGANRMIPGRQYNFSEKFLKKFTCSFYPSRLLQQSSDFYQGLQPKIDLNKDQISGGAMAVILDMLSTDQMKLNMRDEEQYFKAHYNSTLAEVVDDNLSAKWINQGFDVILDTNKPSISHEQHAEPFDTDTFMPPMEAVDALDSDTRSVYDLIDHYGKDGATLPLLKGQLDIPDSKIIQATQQLILESLVIRVGFSDLRLVTYRHVGHWAIPLDDSKHFHPRMWRNIHGKTIPTVLEGCAEAVLQHILSTPGIKQSQLCDIFEGYMAKTEMMDVLQYLEQRHAIKSKQFHEVKKVGLFGRRVFSKSLDNDKIAHDSVIHYWPLAGYYKSIQVSR